MRSPVDLDLGLAPSDKRNPLRRMRTDADQERRTHVVLPAAAPIARRPDRAGLPVAMLRQSDGKVRHDGAGMSSGVPVSSITSSMPACWSGTACTSSRIPPPANACRGPIRQSNVSAPRCRMIVEDELWQTVKERPKSIVSQFEAVAIATRKARARKLHTMRRPVSLLSGLLTCGCCGGRYGPVHARPLRLPQPPAPGHLRQCSLHHPREDRTVRPRRP
ncbi:hypothetical protein MPL3356_310041 [Mesorhizobium plurifarium]|uniref:Uncharacterized protein n=1 Tax=Mesorhizobium plurifarium TaxID=69974 RepID=A0A090DTR6_MESPL|nr:hypothetical protein MPL3356_310041 [Mesorhizobium plurifarium]